MLSMLELLRTLGLIKQIHLKLVLLLSDPRTGAIFRYHILFQILNLIYLN